MELLVGILFEIYGDLMLLIIPDKCKDKKYIWLSRIIAVIVFWAVLTLAVWGSVLISEYNNLWGIALIVAAVVISLVQIIAGIIRYQNAH